jgi:hypothetical protein
MDQIDKNILEKLIKRNHTIGYVQHTSKNVKPYVLNYLYIAYNFISYTTNIQTTIQGAFP